MKTAAMLAALLVVSCRPHSSSTTSSAEPDTPILPVSPGDSWIYQTHLVIPAGVTSPGASAVDTKFQRVRTYLGKKSAAESLPEVDCFEVTVPGFPAEREFVEIHDDRILMYGSLVMRPETTKPMWLETPVPFVIAGMKPGDALPEARTPEGGFTRRTEVLDREDITVPAGTYHCIHLLTTGNDGDLLLVRKVWFAPGHGIIREEKTRIRRGREIFREIQELTARNTGGTDKPPGGQ